MKERGKFGRKILRDGMSHISPDETAKMREKAKYTTKRFRNGMSNDEKVEMEEKETNTRKRLTA